MNMYSFIFDTETSGLPKRIGYDKYHPYKITENYNSSRIVSICWNLYNKEEQVNSNYHIIKPVDFQINNKSKACEINGITQEIGCEKGININEMFDLLKEDLIKCEVIVAHNILFDKNVLLSELFRYNRQDIIEIFLSKNNYCTMKLSKNLLKIKMKFGGFKNPKLIELYQFFFNEDFGNAHSADADVEACAKCYFKMISI